MQHPIGLWISETSKLASVGPDVVKLRERIRKFIPRIDYTAVLDISDRRRLAEFLNWVLTNDRVRNDGAVCVRNSQATASSNGRIGTKGYAISSDADRVCSPRPPVPNSRKPVICSSAVRRRMRRQHGPTPNCAGSLSVAHTNRLRFSLTQTAVMIRISCEVGLKYG